MSSRVTEDAGRTGCGQASAMEVDDDPGPKPRLLLVDDEAPERELLAAELADEYDVETAPDGARALEAVSRA